MGRVPKGMGMKESLLEYEDEDDKTAMTDDMTEMTEKMMDDMTEMTERMSNSKSDDDDEDFAAENAPRLLPPELLYNGQDISACEGQEARDEDLGRPIIAGQSTNGEFKCQAKVAAGRV